MEHLVSLRNHIAAQEQRRVELEARLNELAAEFAEQMQAFGVAPLPVMDANGRSRMVAVEYEGTVTREHESRGCRLSGINAWPLYDIAVSNIVTVRHLPCSRIMAITTTGELWFTEMLNDYQHSYVDTWEPPRSTLVPVAVRDRLFVMGAPESVSLNSWQEVRKQDQHNILIALAQRAHVEGLDTVILPIEYAMLNEYNRLRGY